MRQWFFDSIADFKPKVGFETQFNVHHEGEDYLHLWRVTEATLEKRLACEWRYGDYPGIAVITWELSETPAGATLKLTNTGYKTFPPDNPLFSWESGQAGWDFLLHESLKNFLEQSG